MTNKQYNILAAILWMLYTCRSCSAFSTNFNCHRPGLRVSHPKHKSTLTLSATRNIKGNTSSPITSTETNNNDDNSIIQTRREWTKTMFHTMIAGSASVLLNSNTDVANAADNAGGATIWKTGKAPEVPGQKPKDKGDVKGTKKDPNFLRSVADCRNKCESTYGPDGLGKTSAECLSECQDICCTTYEQCTFAIVPR